MSTALVAREHALLQLTAALDGGGAVVFGDAGVGKTALVGQAADALTAAGRHVDWVVATSASRSMPFGALAGLLPEDLASLHPALVLGAVARRVRERAGSGPAVLVVDDAHLLDEHSAATVLGLVTGGAASVVATVRGGEPAPDAVTALWKDGLLESIDIRSLDPPGTAAFLGQRLDGEISPATVELLWAQTRGNPRYLTEIVRYGQEEGRLVDVGGVWMWSGDMDVPTRLADLVDQHFSGLGEAALDAVAALVLGEPLRFEVLAAVVPPEALAEVERRGLVGVERRGGHTTVQFAHPVLAATAARNLSPIRRRRLAARLVAVDGPVDAVRRATWQLDVDGPVDAADLVAGARALLLTRPAVALRLAERACAHDAGPDAALALAGARAELGDLAGARQAQLLAATRVRDDRERLALRLDELALTTFSERRPEVALARLTQLRHELPEHCALDLDSTEALLTMFAARPGDALVLAERVLATDPPLASAWRAQTARIAGLAHADRSREAVVAADDLVAAVSSGAVGPYAQGLAHAIAAMARLASWDEDRATSTDPSSGRWPVPPAAASSPRIEAVAWPLIEGARRLFEGHLGRATNWLREAVVQQRSGEGLFRSEAVTLLAVCRAAAGAPDEAEALLLATPPDALAVYPGLAEWAAAAVDGARGRPTAVEHALVAAGQAIAAGSTVSSVAYLAEAARVGGAGRAAELLDGLDREIHAPVTAARAVGIRARATGDGRDLLAAAEQHMAIGLLGPAAELAALAVAALGRGPVRARDRAQALVAEGRQRRHDGTPTTEVVLPLTRRELEVARLAASGMSDRDIAATLVVSIRTVESHLAACYRKLDITSRQGLRDVLGGGAARPLSRPAAR